MFNVKLTEPARPERAEALSPGRALKKSLHGLRASALSGRAACIHNNPGLRAFALTIIFALGKIKR